MSADGTGLGRQGTGVDQVADQSVFGPFPRSEENVVLESLYLDIEREASGVEGVLGDYRDAVSDAERRERAESLLKHVAKLGTGTTLAGLIEILYFAGRQGLLRKYSLRFPAYNILDEFFVGSIVPQGPRLRSRPRAQVGDWKIFGRAIDFPIGIPASVLTSNEEWLRYFFRQGYSVLTTRTVRSQFREANQQPNWVFVPSLPDPVELGEWPARVVADPSDWADAGDSNVTTSNSFGVPSYRPDEWQEDLRSALKAVEAGQILIVSVMGDIYEDHATLDLARTARANDFVDVAQMAVACGAEFIELNLSCPNSLSSDGRGVLPPLCEDHEATVEVVRAVRTALPTTVRLIAKLSYLPDPALRSLLVEVGSHLDGVAGINTIQTEVVTKAGQPTFPGRPRAGVSGVAVRSYGLEFVRTLARLRVELDLNYEILGMGGVTDVDSFVDMYKAGASVVQSASGVFANPFLASECIRYGTNLIPPARAVLEDDRMREAVLDRLREVLPRVSDNILSALAPDEYDAAIRLGLPGNEALDVLDTLLKNGIIVRNAQGAVLLS